MREPGLVMGSDYDMRWHLALMHELLLEEGADGMGAVHRRLHKDELEHVHIHQTPFRINPNKLRCLRAIRESPGLSKRKILLMTQTGRVLNPNGYKDINELIEHDYVYDVNLFSRTGCLYITPEGRMLLDNL